MAIFFSKQAMADLLVTAWEGGSTYWVEYADYVPPKGMTRQALKNMAWDAAPAREKEFWKTPEGVPLYSLLPYLPPSVKWRIKFKPYEEGLAYLTPKNMRDAAPKLLREHPQIFARIKDENYDAGDADAWLQMALFGEVVYG